MNVRKGIEATARLSRLVRERWAFSARQLAPGVRVGGYRLRDSGVVVHVRHHTDDLNVFEQTFSEGQTNVPQRVLELVRDRRGGEPRVIDLGANIGLFTAYVMGAMPRAHLTAFEPDAGNAALLRRTVAANPGTQVEVVEACAATQDGEVRFSTGNFANSRIEVDGSGIAVPAVDVLPLLQDADLVKIDIEGAEWALLADERFGAIRTAAIGLEYHTHLAPEGDPVAIITERLETMGYEVEPKPIESLPGHGMVWAWRSAAPA